MLPFGKKVLLRTFDISFANLNENESYEEIIGRNFRFVEKSILCFSKKISNWSSKVFRRNKFIKCFIDYMYTTLYLLICGFLLIMNLMMHLMRPDPALSLLCALILYRTKNL